MNTLFEQTPKREPVVATPLDYRDWRADAPVRGRASQRDLEDAVGAQSSSEIARLEREMAALRELQQQELEGACERAAAEAREEAQNQYRESLEVERTALAHACASLSRERARYFADMQREVVRLALAIAERILHRNVEEDCVALTQVVHAAVSQLAEPEGAVLHVPVAEFDRWKRAMRSAGLRVEADDSMSAGDLRLESMGGSAALGWQTQLNEIERSFEDLLERKQA